MGTTKKNSKKYIFVTGGVTSSLGKGLAAASIACLLERRGIKLNMLKMDPYINVDPGTMSPIQHGEVFVTDDGAETDLDLGHYERFTTLTLSKKNNFTTGQVYLKVIENEREGKYLGKTVQVVPHITDEIKRRIHAAAEDCDLLIGEIGGTVGDIESLPFLEAIRQFALDVGTENVLFIHLVLLPYINAAHELKSKPAQHSVKEMRSIGLFPQIIICRSDRKIDESILDKISMFCNVSKSNVFESPDVETIYELPLVLHKQGLDQRITELLGMWATRPDISALEKVVYNIKNPLKTVKIGIVGKYTELVESYKSLDEALRHGAIANQVKLEPTYIDAEELMDDKKREELLSKVHGILVPGGFGKRGTEGKIRAVEYARVNKIPYFGICLGMQLMVIEFARHVAGLKSATSEEFVDFIPNQAPKEELVIHYMHGQTQDGPKGGNMRLGAYNCDLLKDTLASKIYSAEKITERHRHRLEVNNKYLPLLKEKGLVVSGANPELNLVEISELSEHPYFIGCQYHPEFKSRPFHPHPLFRSFVEASANNVK
jgi:CTP synthase